MTYKTLCTSSAKWSKSYKLWIITADTDHPPQISVIDTVDEPIDH